MVELLVPKIYTPKGLVKENILSGKKVLDLGCGTKKLPGSIGVDVKKHPSVDVVHDLNKSPWPFKNSSFDMILAQHIAEHVDDFISFISEIHRIAKNNAHIIIQAPYFRSVNAFADPTHKRFFATHSLDYFLKKDIVLSTYNYTNFKFRQVGFWIEWPTKRRSFFGKLFNKFIHRHPDFYDQYLSILCPANTLTWELICEKP